MANIKNGSKSGRNLVGSAAYFPASKNAAGKDVPAYYMAKIGLDMRDPKNNPETQSNPWLESHTFVNKDGKELTAHGQRLSVSQMDAIKAAAGENYVESEVDGRQRAEFTVKADLMTVTGRDGKKALLPNTKGALAKSDFDYTPTMMKDQDAMIAKARENVAAGRAAEAAKRAAAPQQAAPQQAAPKQAAPQQAAPKQAAAPQQTNDGFQVLDSDPEFDDF